MLCANDNLETAQIKEIIINFCFSVHSVCCLKHSCAIDCTTFPSCDFTVFLKNITEKNPLTNFLTHMECLQHYPL